MPYKLDPKTGKYKLVEGTGTTAIKSAATSTTKYQKDPTTGKYKAISTTATTAPTISSSKPTAGSRLDPSSPAGLRQIASLIGGRTAEEAEKISERKPKEGFIQKTLDFISRPQYAVTTGVKNIVDKDPTTTFFGGVKQGLTGEAKTTGQELIREITGKTPVTTGQKVDKFVEGLALDILLDPLTYLTFGASGLLKAGGKVLTKEGEKLLAKGLATSGAKAMGGDLVENAIIRMAEKNPALAEKFFDKGGVKVFGKTILSAKRISEASKAIPGLSFVEEATTPIRNAVYSLFNKDVDIRFGRKPNELIDLEQRFSDLAKSRQSEVIRGFEDIARANKLTANEAEYLTNAIETGIKVADPRLENVRRQVVGQLGKFLKTEKAVGIKIGELKNYVPHILVENPISAVPFKPSAARVTFGAIKPQESREIVKILGKNTVTGEDVSIIGKKSALFDVLGKEEKKGLSIIQEGKSVLLKDTEIRQAVVKEINNYFGKDFFDPNLIKNATIRGVASARAVTSAEFLREVKQKFGAIGNGIPSGYVQVEGIPQLKGYFFHPTVANAISNFNKMAGGDEEINAVLRGYDHIQNLWKASVTSMFPAFHGRNAISNVFQNILDIGSAAIDPRRNFLAGRILVMENSARKLDRLAKGTGEKAELARNQLLALNKKAILTDRLGKSYTFGDLRRILKENNVAFSGDHFGYMDLGETIAERVGHIGKAQRVKGLARKVLPVSQEFAPFKVGRNIGQAVEEHGRILNFLTNLQKTGDVITAANRTKRFLFDYGNLSNVEKKILRRIIPFYTWPRKNLELQVRTLLTEPGKITRQAHVLAGLSQYFTGDNGLTEEELSVLPGYIQETLKIPFSKKDGIVQFITGFQIPAESAAKFLPYMLSGVSPILRTPIEAVTGYDFFKRQKLEESARNVSESEYNLYPQAIREYVGFVKKTSKKGNIYYKAVDPVRLHLIRSIPAVSSVESLVKTLESENVSGTLKLMRSLTGIRISDEYDLDEQAAYRDTEIRRKLIDLLSGVGIVSEFPTIPKATKRSIFSGQIESD